MLKVKDFLQNVNLGYYIDFICEVRKLVGLILDKDSIENIEERAKYINNKFFNKE